MDVFCSPLFSQHCRWVFAPTGEALSLSTATKKVPKENAAQTICPSGSRVAALCLHAGLTRCPAPKPDKPSMANSRYQSTTSRQTVEGVLKTHILRNKKTNRKTNRKTGI
jgi:hypothetical protein